MVHDVAPKTLDSEPAWHSVHAAALGRIVRDVIDNYTANPGINPGDMFLTNDTYVGAPHQADVIVVAPIFHGDRLIAWTGSCVHQADVGGPVPGSITVGARNIYEEARPISPVTLLSTVTRAELTRWITARMASGTNHRRPFSIGAPVGGPGRSKHGNVRFGLRFVVHAGQPEAKELQEL